MIVIYLFMYIMFIFMLFMFLISLFFLINKIVYLYEFEFLEVLSMKIEYLILLDWMSLMFMSIMLLISLSILFYSIEYMSMELNKIRFFFLMIFFVLSMIMMIISPNLISILMGWDGLGLVSFCLIIYYQSENSYYCGMVTVLMNRVGDIFLLIVISMMLYMGSWNFMFLNKINNLILFFVMVVAFTKSAQIPFSSWLPLAMAAPTPVSSLVHSSTLVTAGIYLLIRFNYLMIKNYYFLKFIMFISLMTLLMAGMGANMEFDLKKIIALSTLSQLGIMLFCLSMKLMEISFFHLLIHAMFKSMLFMCSGVIIHNMMLNQDIRFLSMITYNMPLISLIFNCSSLSLCGIPFLSGFFSKDKILEMYLMNFLNQIILYMLFFAMGLTVMYTIRLLYYSFFNFMKFNMFYNYDIKFSFMSYSMLLLFLMTLFMGNLMSWLIFSMKNYIFLNLKFKLMIYEFMFMGMLMGIYLSMKKFYKMEMYLMNNLNNFIMKLWYLLLIIQMNIYNEMKFLNKIILVIDKGWNEYLMGLGLIMYIKKILFMELINKNFFYMMIYVFYLIMIMIF